MCGKKYTRVLKIYIRSVKEYIRVVNIYTYGKKIHRVKIYTRGKKYTYGKNIYVL